MGKSRLLCRTNMRDLWNGVKFEDITYKIIKCAMKVHTELGNGFKEQIYQKALEKAFADDGLQYKKEVNMPAYFDGMKVGDGRVDFIVEHKILLELKAQTLLDNVHLRQALNYLKASEVEVGLLINFGAKRLEFKRLVK